MLMEVAGNNDTLDTLAASLKEDWARQAASQDDCIERIGNVRGLLRSLAGALEKQKAEDAELRQRYEQELDAVRAALDGAGDKSELETKIGELESQVSALTAQLAEASASADAQTQRIVDLESSLGEQEAALNAARESAGDAAKMNQELAELREAERALKNELATLRPKAEEASAAREALDAEASDLRRELAELKTKLETAQKRAAELEEAGASGREAIEAAESSAELAQKRADALERDVADALAKAADAERAVAEMRQSYEDALAAQEEMGGQLNQLQKQLDAELEKARSAEEQLEDERSKGTKSALASQLSDALQEADEARAEVRELKRKLEQALKAGNGASAPRRTADEEVNLVRKAAEAKGGGKFAIGELLVNAGLVTQEQVDEAIDEQRGNRQQHIGAILVSHGWASEEAVAQALAYQCNVPFVRVADLDLKPECVGLISERLAHQHSCVPVDNDDVSMTLAMVNPLDLVAIEDIERATTRKVEVVVGVPREINQALEKYFWEPN